MQSRPTRRLAKKLKKAARSASFRNVAKTFGITTPAGKPNPGLVYRMIYQGYEPKRLDTKKRSGLLPADPISNQPVPGSPQGQSAIENPEPARRVLTGAWNLGGLWVTPEEYFKAVHD
jgi:hypothetical protein